MNHIFGRRVTTAAASLAVAAGTLLAASGIASATPNPAADRTATISYSSGIAIQHGDDRSDRGGDRSRDDRGGWYVYDGHRKWERHGSEWYCDDGGQRYSYDGHRFHRWDNGKWVNVNAEALGLSVHIFR
ncbi:hypothetical protein ACIPSJ_51805 [Streptomyces sp. NPDC090088]|uniref:hypothetical protein n=1 Tax=Streptomyces sp. NPDC090088 TaxID=3365944 RepID=UPI0038119DC1